MGNAASRVFNTATKGLRDFNVENRAHRVISRDKPKPAPRYPADERELERIVKEHPEVLLEQTKKLTDLDKRLKTVFVVSHDPEHDVKQQPSSNRPLPVARNSPQRPEFGFEEPAEVAPGKVTLKNVLQFIYDHQTDPLKWSKENIAKQYKLEAECVENILANFRPLLVLVPEGKKGKKQQTLSVSQRIQKLSS
ncbi:protein NDUFAF4 homolog [Neocloeon triangulifer]|uniref:protein NDUFAF4 homolog n=1 Tax=Neocloeon triangulifer TaxID=2078957 RepID=UPI00286F2148|nr:protein NDUFAF4 homolog [Neocloeon triangulifer]